MDVQIADDLCAQAFAAIACWLRRDQEGFDGVVGSDEEAAALLPVVIGELVAGLERLVGPAEVRRQVIRGLMFGVRGSRDDQRFIIGNVPSHGASYGLQTRLHSNLPRMQFRVRTADGTVTWDGSYKIDKNGVLRILPEDEGKPLIHLSPAYWREINESRSSDIGKSVD